MMQNEIEKNAYGKINVYNFCDEMAYEHMTVVKIWWCYSVMISSSIAHSS